MRGKPDLVQDFSPPTSHTVTMNSTNFLTALPEDVLLTIIELLHICDILSIRQVCCFFLVGDGLLIQHVDLSNPGDYEQAAIAVDKETSGSMRRRLCLRSLLSTGRDVYTRTGSGSKRSDALCVHFDPSQHPVTRKQRGQLSPRRSRKGKSLSVKKFSMRYSLPRYDVLRPQSLPGPWWSLPCRQVSHQPSTLGSWVFRSV